MRDQLQADLDTSQQQHARPVFHKIGFDDATVYLTKSYFYEAGIPVTGKNSSGNYRLFSWADARAKAFLGFELGQQSPALGRANIIGSFTPIERDLRDVKYATDQGKAFYKSARFELTGEGQQSFSTTKIDAEHFMEMKEIIPTGAQGKAIYGDGNYIIDGAAGTGKSTTVLQKLKLLQLQNNVDADQIAIVVKNTAVVARFQELLSSIKINGISIFTVDEMIDTFHPASLQLSDTAIEEMHQFSLSVFTAFNAVCDVQKLTSFGYDSSAKDFEALTELVPSHLFKSQLDRFISECKALLSDKVQKDKEFSINQKRINDAAEQLSAKLTLQQITKNQKALGNRIRGVLGISSRVNELSLAEETKIKDLVNKDKKSKQDALTKEKSNWQKRVSEKTDKLEAHKRDLTSRLIEQACISINPASRKAQTLYFNKCFNRSSRFHTVIIDEAQDVSGKSIELVRLLADNTILTGDELQRETITGIGSWSNLLINSVFSKDGKLNLFELKHNFRQTYELGLVSYNYRQLMLGRELADIRAEYFDDQIGFERPKVVEVFNDKQFISLVKAQITYISETFTKQFPLVVFYETQAQLETLIGALEGQFSHEVDADTPQNCDVFFVNIKNIAGREFPVVIAPLSRDTTAATLYIMLSRPKFNLTLITKELSDVDEHISALCEAGYLAR